MNQPKTTKLAFLFKENKVYEKEYRFNFYGGFALSEKQKTILAFHTEIEKDGITNILEISSKSKNPIGKSLSAFNLKLSINKKSYTIESIYQSSKVFQNSIQFTQVLEIPPFDAKKFVKEEVQKQHLILNKFQCFGYDFPINPPSLFYDFIYVSALNQNPEITKELINFTCFTDVEFNHKKQVASQARSCAIYCYLHQNKLLDKALNNIDFFKEIYSKVIVSYQLMLLD
jgi:type I restriction enzyme M protein